ncbi:CDP-alcohol phosphatidyltransferase family protein [Gorillibacterium sp. sgz5001074]|uniref:CDP-alcohol phosphatidyltransferase family protein n=1 Tax=Gorillibacterium sp. sgz5001074 TaxID=3446695 RepID=UPI003F671028
MNLPNMLTILRFVLIPVYAWVFKSGNLTLAFAILVLAGVTDVLDGYIARTRGLVTELGSMLDPLADKLMLITVILSLLLSEMIPWAAAAAFFLRDAGMIMGSLYFHLRGKKTVPANTLGKLTTVLFYLAILLIVFDLPYAIPYLWSVIGFAFLTSLFYIISFRKINEIGPDANRKRAHF